MRTLGDEDYEAAVSVAGAGPAQTDQQIEEANDARVTPFRRPASASPSKAKAAWSDAHVPARKPPHMKVSPIGGDDDGIDDDEDDAGASNAADDRAAPIG